MRNKKVTRFHCLKVLEWCTKRYGRGRDRYPYVEFKKADYTVMDITLAEYDYEDGIMFIYSDRVNKLEDLVHTVIHEYCHYRYHTKSMMWKMDSEFGYEKNPCELEAEFIANRDWKRCLNELKKYYPQFKV